MQLSDALDHGQPQADPAGGCRPGRVGPVEAVEDARQVLGRDGVDMLPGDVLTWCLVSAAALAAGTLSAVTGFGGAAILLPLLVAAFGPREAVPILAVAQLIGNGSRVWFNRRELDWRVAGCFALGAAPAAVEFPKKNGHQVKGHSDCSYSAGDT